MNFRDRWVEDENGRRFIFTVEMQRQLSQAGLPIEPASLKLLSEGQGVRKVAEVTSMKTAVSSTTDTAEKDLSFTPPATIQIDPQTGKYLGRMKWFNSRKGYGFIMRGGGEEIFFHKSNTLVDPEQLQEGQWVLYDVEETNKGPEATDVEPYEGDTSLLE